jgi:hypothetical protein
MTRALFLPLLLVAAVGCDSSDANGDGGAGGDDQSVPSDGGGPPPPDLFGRPPPDMTCILQQLQGFLGASTGERRVSCACGCTIDSFTNASQVNQIWNGTIMSTTFAPSSSGLNVTPDSPDGGTALGALTSLNPAGPFFLDGDFDLLVDYELTGTLPPSAEALLQVNNPKPPIDSTYTIERQTNGAGSNEYRAALAGIQPVTQGTAKTSGTLELSRAGFTVKAIADGTEVSQYTGDKGSRLAVLLTAGINGCAGGSCRFTVKWRNLRLVSGTLVDRN